MHAVRERYTAVAIVLHWAIAVALLTNIAVGWWMHQAIETPQSRAAAVAAFQIHKSIGLSILLLSLVRLAWRLLYPPPALPASMPTWEKAAAKTTHWLFYLLMIAVPLSGWIYVSTQWRGNTPLQLPTLWFGLFEVPHLFGLDEAARSLRQRWSGVVFNAHWFFAWSTAVLFVLHVAAALKHQFVNHDGVLAHMVPVLERRERGNPWRKTTLWIGFAGIAAASVAVASLLLTPAGRSGNIEIDRAARTNVSGDGSAPAAGEWALDRAASAIRFSGEQGGSPFKGRFERWRVDIRIDADDIPSSHIAATIETGSATDGQPMHDKTLPQKEWFHVEKYPVATFRATDIRRIEPDRYALSGQLTIKDNDIPVKTLTLALNGDTATISGRTTIDRADANLGMDSDPEGEWVSRQINVNVQAVAKRGMEQAEPKPDN